MEGQRQLVALRRLRALRGQRAGVVHQPPQRQVGGGEAAREGPHRVEVGDVAAPDAGRVRSSDGGGHLRRDALAALGVAHDEVDGGTERGEVEGRPSAQARRRARDGDVPAGEGPDGGVGGPAGQAAPHGETERGEARRDRAVQGGVDEPGGGPGERPAHVRDRIAAMAPRR